MEPGPTAIDELVARLEELVELLEEAEERYWALWIRRCLTTIEEGRLAGISQVLAAYGGEDTFSDLVLLPDLEERDHRRFVILNRRLEHLRDSIFALADGISNSTASGPH